MKDIFIIKGRFHLKTSNVYGIFVLLIDTALKELAESYVYVSRYSDFPEANINTNWEELEPILTDIFLNNRFSSSLTQNYRSCFRDALKNRVSSIEDILYDYKEKNFQKTVIAMESIIVLNSKEKNVGVELAYEEIAQDELDHIRHERGEQEAEIIAQENTQQNPDAKPISVTQNYFNIPAHPVLDPSHGIPARDLRIGTLILTSIDVSTEYGRKCVKLLKAKEQGTDKPIPLVGRVEQVGIPLNKTVNIVINYGNKTLSIFDVEQNIRVKTYESDDHQKVIHPSNIAQEQEQKQQAEAEEYSVKKSPDYLLIGAVVVFVMLLYFLVRII